MGRLFVLLVLPLLLFGGSVKPFKWNDGESFLTFLEQKHLPLSLYYRLDKDDQTLTEDIPYNANCQMVVDNKNIIRQILIPVNDELQIQIYLTPKKTLRHQSDADCERKSIWRPFIFRSKAFRTMTF